MASNRRRSLLTLPIEIQLMIWTRAFPAFVIIKVHVDSGNFSAAPARRLFTCPSLLLVNHQVYHACHELWQPRIELVMPCFSHTLDFPQFSYKQRSHISKVTLRGTWNTIPDVQRLDAFLHVYWHDVNVLSVHDEHGFLATRIEGHVSEPVERPDEEEYPEWDDGRWDKVRQMWYRLLWSAYVGKRKIWPSLTNPSTHPTLTSQPLFGESVNNNLAAQAPSPSRSLVTISPFDFTSFTTDHQQTWLSQPPSSAASAQSTHQHHFDKDFELFATVPENRNQHNSSLRPATQNIHPSSLFPHQPPHRQLAQAQLAHLSTTGYNQLSTNQRSFSSPTLHQHPSYHQHPSQLRQKPPVPLFSDATVNRQVPRRRPQSDSSALPGPGMAFDNLYLTGGDDLFVSQEELMTSLDQYPQSNFTAINSSPAMQNAGTVSPQELLNSFATPESSYLESPMMGSSAYATTPLEDGGFMDDTLDFSSMNMPLFPQDGMDQFMETSMQRVHSQSFTQSASASPMVRQRSGPSPGSRPGTAHSRKHSLVAGVAKASATKSRKALPEIVIQEDDAKEIAKRKKNTAAARKSRENRANRMESLEAEVLRLRGIVLDLGVDPDEGVESPE